jgi:hypothetical protein
MLRALMRANGVARTVIIQAIYYGWDHSYAADVLRQYPQYFRGVARVNPENQAAPDDLSRPVQPDCPASVEIYVAVGCTTATGGASSRGMAIHPTMYPIKPAPVVKARIKKIMRTTVTSISK